MSQIANKIGDTRKIRHQKRVLIALIALSSVSPLLFLNLHEETVYTSGAKLLAKVGSLCGTVLFAWQFVLGFRGVVSAILTDLVWVVGLHRRLGQWASGLILLHPVFISIYYVRTNRGNPLLPDIQSFFGIAVLLGFVALGLIALLYVTSVKLRARLRTLLWFRLHLSSYAMLALAFVHSLSIGTTVRGTALRYGWVGLTGAMVLFCVYRVLYRLGVFGARYVVTGVFPTAPRVVEITARPLTKRIVPKLGQFIYFRRSLRGNAQPYTVSYYQEDTGEIGITAKALGKRSGQLQYMKPGRKVGVDGPYGVFGWEAARNQRPLVMIAGGIGITPFRRLVAVLEETKERPAYLFYGSQRYKDIVYREELDACSHVKIIHVLNAQPDYGGHKGFITVELIRSYCVDDPAHYEYMICGPGAMVAKIEAALRRASVPTGRIHHELFSW
ncbi:MAG: hypothetical protein GF344_17685 [Chitinivibrionales bacterium]|nr:hypothetical protein [Chitinivibrionales bacterium]MBD3358500.1 hypothetical protein [Chitinivibrionales bacterium]